ncbi:MAG: hypothetical protein AAGA55_04190, partial [Planctomycetota bacterium]
MIAHAEETSALLDPPRRKRRRRWKRKSLLIVAVLLGAAMLLLQTPAAALIVRPILASQTGMIIETGAVRISPIGNVTIDGARFLAPGMPGQPGEVLVVDRTSARIDWMSTLTGAPGLKSVRLTRPALRLSQDTRSGVINASAFQVGGGGGRTPAVEIVDGSIELGEHRGAVFTPLRRWRVVGNIEEADGSGVAAFSVAAVTEPSGRGETSGGTLGIDGTLNAQTVEGRLDGLRLEDWPASIVPTRARGIYERLDLRGTLLPTRFAIDRDGRGTGTKTLDGVGLKNPIDES